MSFFQISTSSTDQILATMSGLFDSVSPILLIIISLALGFWIISLVVGVSNPKETRYTVDEYEAKQRKAERYRKNRDQEHISLTPEEEFFEFGDYDEEF